MSSGGEQLNRPNVKLSRDYIPSLRMLVTDLEEILQYVEPTDENLKVFSHRLYAVLLRACTEVESLLKEYGRALEDSSRKLTCMKEYSTLERDYHLAGVAVDALMWMPETRRLHPFAEWRSAELRLPWYQGYNAVKHDRQRAFREANLENALSAVSAAFMLVAITGVVPSDGAHLIRPGGTWDDRRGFTDFPFELVGAWSMRDSAQ